MEVPGGPGDRWPHPTSAADMPAATPTDDPRLAWRKPISELRPVRYRCVTFGYCDLDAREVVRVLEHHGPDALRDLPGEYALAIEAADEVYLVTSPFGAVPYHYAVRGQRLYHGPQVLDVVRAAALGWRWNWRALGDLFQLGNLVGDDCLHAQVHRLPPGSVLHFKHGKLALRTRPWFDLCADADTDRRPPDRHAARVALNDELSRWADDHGYLSLSPTPAARVVLSGLLQMGCKPSLISVGVRGSEPVRLATRIAATFALAHRRVEVELDDWLTHGRAIARLTDGALPAWEWHPFIYPLPAVVAREEAYYTDPRGAPPHACVPPAGFVGHWADRWSARVALTSWKRRLRDHTLFKPSELSGVASELSGQLDTEALNRRARRLLSHNRGGGLSGLARHGLEQRVAHLHAHRASLYRAHAAWRSPYFSRTWVREMWRLRAQLRPTADWQRFAIEHNLPTLLSFESSVRWPQANAPAGLRGGSRKRPSPAPGTAKHAAARWLRSDRVRALMLDQAGHVADLVHRDTLESILAEHRALGTRTRTLSYLLETLFFKLEVDRPL